MHGRRPFDPKLEMIAYDELKAAIRHSRLVGQQAIERARQAGINTSEVNELLAISGKANENYWRRAQLLEKKVIVAQSFRLTGLAERLVEVAAGADEWRVATAQDKKEAQGQHFVVAQVYELEREFQGIPGQDENDRSGSGPGIPCLSVRISHPLAPTDLSPTITEEELRQHPIYGLPLDNLQWGYPDSQTASCM